MKHTKKNGKYVFQTGGIYLSRTIEQIDELANTLAEIQKAERQTFKCIVDGEIDDCVWDGGDIHDCDVASSGIKKEDCEYWKAV